VLAVLVLAVLAAVGWAVFLSPLLALGSVSVSGADGELTRAQVLAAARPPYGTPLPRVSTGAIRQRVAALPRVASVRVSRGWPTGLRISVVQRTAVAALQTDSASARYVFVDAVGVRFAAADRPPSGIPVVRLELTAAGRVELPAIPERRLVDGAVRVAGDLPSEVRGRTSAVEVRSYDDIELRLPGGVLVKWGSPERGSWKARVLTALMRSQNASGSRGKSGGSDSARNTVFDVSAPDAPAVAG
jgi:cell division protein FtsQ